MKRTISLLIVSTILLIMLLGCKNETEQIATKESEVPTPYSEKCETTISEIQPTEDEVDGTVELTTETEELKDTEIPTEITSIEALPNETEPAETKLNETEPPAETTSPSEEVNETQANDSFYTGDI